jgi:hypothetical protein
MKNVVLARNTRLAAALLLGGGAAAGVACSTTAVDNVPDGGSSSSASNASTTGGGSTSSASNGSTTTSSSASTVTVVCTQPASPDGGFASLIDFSKACGGDAGPNLACFGTYPTLYGGTFSFSPTADSAPDDSGVGCNIFGSQSTFTATLDTTAKTWTLGGEIGGYSGGGLYIGPCVDASAYTGIEFTLGGSIAATSDAAGSNQLQVQVSQLSNWNVASAGGDCLTAGETCSPSIANIDVPATPSDVKVPFSTLSGGAPVAAFDPAHIIQIQWQLPWQCQGGTPYMASVTIANVQFYK